jgi:hypothetical protein
MIYLYTEFYKTVSNISLVTVIKQLNKTFAIHSSVSACLPACLHACLSVCLSVRPSVPLHLQNFSLCVSEFLQPTQLFDLALIMNNWKVTSNVRQINRVIYQCVNGERVFKDGGEIPNWWNALASSIHSWTAINMKLEPVLQSRKALYCDVTRKNKKTAERWFWHV